jgi:hypothetical protein
MEEIIAAFSPDEAELLDFGVSDDALESRLCSQRRRRRYTCLLQWLGYLPSVASSIG